MLHEILTNAELYITGFIVTAIVAYALAVTSLFIRVREFRVKRKKKFFKALLEGLRNDCICSIDDVIDIYRGVFPATPGMDDNRHGLSRQLREFLVELVSKQFEHASDDKVVLAWKEKISEFIRISDAKTPFIDLPTYERNVLEDLAGCIDRHDDEGMRRKLMEVGGLVRARIDALNRIRGLNRWSVPISIVGLVLTAVFGAFAIIK